MVVVVIGGPRDCCGDDGMCVHCGPVRPLWQLCLLRPLWSLVCVAGVVSVEGDGGLQVLEGADLGTQAQVRRGEHGLRPRARDVGHRGGHV